MSRRYCARVRAPAELDPGDGDGGDLPVAREHDALDLEAPELGPHPLQQGARPAR